MPEVFEITHIDGLDQLRDDWRRLMLTTPRATFFHSLEWLKSYWRHYGEDQSLRVVVAREADRVAGIAPFVIRSEETKVGPLRFLTYPLDYWGSFYSPLGADPQQVLALALAHLQEASRDWDVLELRWVGGAADEAAQTRNTLDKLNMSAEQTRLEPTSLVDLDGSWDQFLAAKGTKWRNNFKRWKKRLAAKGEVSHFRYRPRGAELGESDPRWDLYEQCVELARLSWQGQSEDGTTLSHDSVAPFLRDAHQAAAQLGALDLNMLYLDDQPLAFLYNYHWQGRLFGLRIGYDARQSRDGVGNLLYAAVIEDSFRRGDLQFDLGPGSLDCKRHFRSELRQIHRFSHFPSWSIRPQLLRLKRRLESVG